MRIRKLPWLLAALLLSAPLYADQDALRNGHPERHVVQKGDTLWDISKTFLRDPWLWPEIWYNNPDIKNPHLIYPGDTISLVYVDGQPRLTVQTADRLGETVKLSPGNGKLSPQIREVSMDKAIPTIPLEAIRPFLTESMVAEENELDRAPYILANSDSKVAASGGDKIYARGMSAQEPGAAYSVVRKGRAYVDPDTKKVLGYEALHLGNARLLESGDPSSLRLTSANREVLGGDRLLPRGDAAFQGNFFPKAPATQVNGRIIDVMDGVSQIGQYSVVVLNRGSSQGLQVGDVLAVYQSGELVRDPYSGKRGETVKLPDESAGQVIVFRTFNELSLGLVMEATRPMHVMDAVRNP